MAIIAIYCVDAELRRQREALVRANAAFTIIGAVAADAALRSLLEQHAVDVVLADAPPPAPTRCCRDRPPGRTSSRR